MVNAKASTLAVVFLMCLIQLPFSTSASYKYKNSKRFNKIPTTGDSKVSKRTGLNNELMFKGDGFPDTTIGVKHSSLVLNCECGGPVPTIHWLKDGVRIQQGVSHNVRDDAPSYENHQGGHNRKLKLSTTISKLYLDCLNEDDNAVYTCVAETPLTKIVQSTTVKVVKPDYDVFSDIDRCFGKRSSKGEPARIYMWTSARLEYENNRVQLYCRAQGFPAPTITWYDPSNKVIEEDDMYKIGRNGDLIIDNVSWLPNMGVYTCEADNGFGTDSVSTFLYPTRRDFV